MRTWLPEFFDRYVARPLNMPTFHQNLMPNGEASAAGGIFLRPRDQLKLGQLCLNRGTWNGKRIVSEKWVDVSMQQHSSFDPDHGYGFTWHIYNTA